MVVDHTQRRAQLSTHGTHGVLLLLVTIGHVTGKPRFGEGALAMLAANVLWVVPLCYVWYDVLLKNLHSLCVK